MKAGFVHVVKALFLYTVCMLLLHVPVSMAEEQPIEIQADGMTSLEESKTVVFTGNVDARQGDIRIRSNKMTIYYFDDPTAQKNKKGKNAQQIDKVICEGKVEVTSEDWLGTSKVMHYYSKKNLVRLIGKAVAYQGQNMVKGQRIDYHTDTGQSEVFGGADVKVGEKSDGEKKKPGRVKMTILEQ